MTVRQLFPADELLPVDDIILRTKSAPVARPFSSAVLDACSMLSRAFMRDRHARQYSELQALGFQLRRSQLELLGREFEQAASPDVVFVPRGLVFHIPPGNVESVMVYSWLYAMLCGNRSIIRLSANRSESRNIILRLIGEVNANVSGLIGDTTSIIEYGHEANITERISRECDLRVIWGGNDTINIIRQSPLQPRARDITFADRSSLCVVSADSYLTAAAEKKVIASGFFNDTYTFQQLACSSPRVLIWQGTDVRCREASAIFIDELRSVILRRGHETPLNMAMSAFLLGCREIIDNENSAYSRYSNELSIIQQRSPADAPEEHCGGGVLFQAFVRDIYDLAQHIRPQYQTLTYFGFSTAELRHLAAIINGRGIDRMVPIGQALTFHHYWDGYDLLQEMTKRVYIASESAGAPRASQLLQSGSKDLAPP